MKVILLKELPGKGGEGDIIDVARGFANNYLLTQGFAVLATPGNLKQLENRRKNIAKREEERLAQANATKAALEDAKVEIAAKIGEEGQLFGSITSTMIAQAIKDTKDLDIDRRRIEIRKAIKTAGAHEVHVSLYRGISATVQVHVGDAAAPEKTDDTTADANAEHTAEVQDTTTQAEESAVQ